MKLNKNDIVSSINKFLSWKDSKGYLSFDPYDLWSTKYGIWSKGLFYKSKILGSLFVAPIFIADIFFPSIRKLINRKKRYPIADAHFMKGYLSLYHYSGDENYLNEAKILAEDLLKSSIKGYAGFCWGFPFNWMSTRGLWTSQIPLITTTGYCFEAYLKLYDATKDEQYLKIAHSIYLFALHDLKDTFIEEHVAASSYTPIDNSQIVNASAYRLHVLLVGANRFQHKEGLEKARLNLNFILKSQNDDGSWLYAVNDRKDNFIDNFHTCFVLKNLVKVNRLLHEEEICRAIKKGFDFYKKKLLDQDGLPIPYALLSRFNFVKRELYDYAEAISLCVEMNDLDDEASQIREKLIFSLINDYQKPDGSFITREVIFNIKNRLAYIRWPQAQLFCSLAKCLET